jgi:ADP-ribosyl-[dinitrogen reductase] hydrolase
MPLAPSLDSRVRGALLGLAWGDALGCPVEGWREADISAVYGRYEALPEAYSFEKIAPMGVKVLRRLRPLGLHSDDAQQALALLSICLSDEGWSPEAWGRLLVEGRRCRAWRGTGRNFDEALRKLAKGVPPRQSGSASAGIGAAMRIGPLGALYRDDPETLARVAMESALVTHGDIRAGGIAFAIARAVADFIAGRSAAEVAASLPRAVGSVETAWLQGRQEWQIDRAAGHLVSETLSALFERLDRDDPLALRERLSKLAGPNLAEGFAKAHPNQGFALLGGAHALAMALRSDAKPAETLGDIIRLGYDTDTVAAIAGSLLGARFGDGWIPTERLLDGPRLSAWANALVRRADPPESPAQLLEREAAWSRQEEEFQAGMAQHPALRGE